MELCRFLYILRVQAAARDLTIASHCHSTVDVTIRGVEQLAFKQKQ